jgi:hypothetical protein
VSDPEPHISNRDQARLARLNRRLRQAFIEGAEVDMRRLLGRGLTAEGLERVLRRYPGDVRERREQQQVVVLNCGEPDSGLPTVEEP